MKGKTRYLWGAVALTLGLGLLTWGYLGWQRSLQSGPEQGAIAHNPGAEGDSARAPSLAGLAQPSRTPVHSTAATSSTWVADRFAPSLGGTEVDGQLMADAEGNLIINSATKDFFDYFLMAVGEVTEADAIAEIERQARASLPPGAADQAMQLLRDYLAFHQAQQAYLEQPPSMPRPRNASEFADQLAATFDDLKRLRRNYMGEEAANAFFAMEEAYGDYTVDAIRIQSDSRLTTGEKAGLLRSKAMDLPAPLRETKLRQIEDEIRAEAGLVALNSARNEEDLRQRLNQAGFSAQKTDELVDFWYQDRQFQQRYARYQEERQRVLASGLDRADQEGALERLRLSHFDNPEERMRALMRDMGQ